jgi:hypothetical protein
LRATFRSCFLSVAMARELNEQNSRIVALLQPACAILHLH